MRKLFGWVALAATAGAALSPLGCGDSDSADDGGGSGAYCEKEPAGSTLNTKLGCDLRCPGDPGCKPTSDPTLFVGAAVEDVTPVVDYVVAFAPQNVGHNYFDPFGGDRCVKKGSCDLNDIKTCTAEDPMLCTWIAGFGSARPAIGNADPTTVRCAVLKQGNTKVGLCSIDVVGWFYNEIERTRELIASDYPDLDLDFLGVAAGHVHETQDTMGIWGPEDTASGVKKDYNALIRKKTAEALAKANAALEPVSAEFGATKVDGHIAVTDPAGHGTASFVSDTRDPVVLDDELRTIRFVATDGGNTVATLINFASHPEFAGEDNLLTSADYLHTLRESIEKGLTVKSGTGTELVKQDGFGGVAIYFNGALGGQVGPGNVVHTDFEGNPVPAGLERANNNGRMLSVYAHEAMTAGVTKMETPALGVRAREIYVDVHNTAYHVAIVQQLFDREGYFFDPNRELSDENFPAIRSQIFVVDIGPAELVSVPGELHAELLLATPDGKSALDAPYPFTPAPFKILNDKQSNPDCGADGVSRCDDGPPDIAQMDRDKIVDLARDPLAKFHWVIGLGQDEFGYVVPAYDYKLDPQNPYLEEASPGDHYEETNSVGPDVQSLTVDPILQLLRSPPVVKR
jgi:hypothetical protein